MELHAIHGFLGLPEDWHKFKMPSMRTYNLSDPEIAPGQDGFWGWAKRFNCHTLPSHGILMGYSLGGRLAMHALLDNPARWKAGIIISSHTGYKKDHERAARLAADAAWADRFENERWEKVLSDWNAQPVFAGMDFPMIRHEHQFSRKELGSILRLCSRGHQDDLSASIQNFQLPILWICGKLDPTFPAAAKNLHFSHPLSRVEIVEGAAHRVPWEQPEKFLKIIQSFINEVASCL